MPVGALPARQGAHAWRCNNDSICCLGAASLVVDNPQDGDTTFTMEYDGGSFTTAPGEHISIALDGTRVGGRHVVSSVMCAALRRCAWWCPEQVCPIGPGASVGLVRWRKTWLPSQRELGLVLQHSRSEPQCKRSRTFLEEPEQE